MTPPSDIAEDSHDPTHHPEAVLAGTLCLMSCYVQNPAALYAERVTSNLARLATFAGLSPELRTVCKRLSERWEAILRAARQRIERGEAVQDARALH